MLRNIYNEIIPDYSAQICEKASVDDLDNNAINHFREGWIVKSKKDVYARLSYKQLLKAAGLIVDDGLTYAALILFGTPQSLDKHLPTTEVIFEYYSNEISSRYQQRKNYRAGFFLYHKEMWDNVNLRNEMQHLQDGLFLRDIPTFDEEVVREALLNAVSHRDYRYPGSIFVRQSPSNLRIESPGGFPTGVTIENILDMAVPRNRLIAESFEKCGLVERSGLGMDMIFANCIKQSKPLPDFIGTDDHM